MKWNGQWAAVAIPLIEPPAMKLVALGMVKMMWPWHCIPEEQYVERVRRRLAQFERVRRWFVGLYVTLAIAFIWIVVKFCALLAAIPQAPNNAAPGFFGFGLGMLFGVLMGLIASKIGYGLAIAFMACRTERLMVKYHDALHAAPTSTPYAPNAEERLRV
ncbi:MAG: hypothetical protein NTY19_26470 [Planctomycetota bacterium]|nr:hypothetical protein [Planctomycetota bacterium]